MTRHTTLSLAVILALTVLFGSLALPAIGDAETGFINGQVTVNGLTMRYVVYVPRNYSPDKQWPVILFLHGAYADEGDGLGPYAPLLGTLPLKGPYSLPGSIIWGGSLGGAVTRKPQRFPCLVVWPQIPGANTLGPWSGRFEDLALQALEEVVVNYNGDRNRLYVTGISLGGGGTWNFATDHPDLFAAAMPIAGCGVYGPKTIAQALKSLPIWVFHGGHDDPQCARAMFAAIQAAGNPNIRYTEYPDADHNVWDIAYNDPKVIAWLLAQHR